VRAAFVQPLARAGRSSTARELQPRAENDLPDDGAADETEHWLQLIADTNLVTTPAAVDELAWLRGEAAELRAMFVQSVKTARANYARARGQIDK
jgi:hypothetical protein